jgi:hypothetical protein
MTLAITYVVILALLVASASFLGRRGADWDTGCVESDLPKATALGRELPHIVDELRIGSPTPADKLR